MPFNIPSDNSEEDEDESLPNLFLNKLSKESNTNESYPSHFIPGVTNKIDKANQNETHTTKKAEETIPKKKITVVNPSKNIQNKPLPKRNTKQTNQVKLQSGTPTSSRAILVHPIQKHNPVLKYIDNCKYIYNDKIIPDFVLGPTRCAIFISLRYHTENAGYLESRLHNIPHCFTLKIIICFVDRPDSTLSLHHISKLSITNKCTLICAWSNLEAARYLETYKVYQNKPADSIMGKIEDDYESRLMDCLTSIKSVNKTDVKNLASGYGTLKNIINADMEELAITDGLGTKKVKDIFYTFHKPFKPKPKES